MARDIKPTRLHAAPEGNDLPLKQPDRTEGAIVRAAWVAARGGPAHVSELVSQWLCGETLEILESADGWLRCRGVDGYVAWTPAGGVLSVGLDDLEGWVSVATGFCLGVGLETPVQPAGPNRLPFGARVEVMDGGTVRLPDGGVARPSDPGRIAAGHLPPDPEAVTAAARSWLGTPYMWGGRSDWGADCSGFVQLVYAAHGIGLPRDSYQQFEAGPRLDDTETPTAGDLLFYAETPGRVTHVAMCLDDRYVIHSSASNGAVQINDMEGDGPLEEKLRRWRVGATRPLAAR